LCVGGTESLILAVLAYRGYGRQERGITKPNIVIPVTGHVAFDKVSRDAGEIRYWTLARCAHVQVSQLKQNKILFFLLFSIFIFF
jgi:hypothetical protein